MKENVLDVLMYLFENYLYGEGIDPPTPVSDFDGIHDELLELGFGKTEVTKAFRWLEDLGEKRQGIRCAPRALTAIRVYSPEEEKKLGDPERREEFARYLEGGIVNYLNRSGGINAYVGEKTNGKG